MKCNSCRDAILRELSSIKGIKIEDINVQEQRLVLQLGEESPSAFQIQSIIEDKLKINAIIRGNGNFVTSVAEIRGSEKYQKNVIGVARFVQNESKQCLLDAVIDGLEMNQKYQIGVHEYGDLSEPSYSSIGNQIFSFAKDILCTSTKLNIKNKVDNCDLASFIGHAFAISKGTEVVGAGIVARASKVMDNSKKICACSGRTLWEEREDNKI